MLYDGIVGAERTETTDESESLYEAMERPPEEAIPQGLSGDWWVAHTKPRSEKLLATDLMRFSESAMKAMTHPVGSKNGAT